MAFSATAPMSGRSSKVSRSSNNSSRQDAKPSVSKLALNKGAMEHSFDDGFGVRSPAQTGKAAVTGRSTHRGAVPQSSRSMYSASKHVPNVTLHISSSSIRGWQL